jgi:hypothetical protein
LRLLQVTLRGQWRKCLTVGAFRAHRGSIGLDPTPPGIPRAILRSRSRRSGSFELRQVEDTSSGGHATPASVVSLSRRSGLGWSSPTYCCLRDQLASMLWLPECLRCLISRTTNMPFRLLRTHRLRFLPLFILMRPIDRPKRVEGAEYRTPPVISDCCRRDGH